MIHIYGNLMKAILYIEISKWRHRPPVRDEILLAEIQISARAHIWDGNET